MTDPLREIVEAASPCLPKPTAGSDGGIVCGADHHCYEAMAATDHLRRLGAKHLLALRDALVAASKELCAVGQGGTPRLDISWPLHGGIFETCKYVTCVERRAVLAALDADAKVLRD